MASSLALRNELCSAIVRGFQRLKAIEVVRELADHAALEAHMAESTVSPDGKSPTPLDILLACEAVQSRWSENDRDARLNRTYRANPRLLKEEDWKAYRKAYHDTRNKRIADKREAEGLSRCERKVRRVTVA